VIDDGSSDGTHAFIKENFPSVLLIRGKGDWYWTGSVFRGVENALELSASNEDCVLMLNDDLLFDADFVETLLAFVRNNPRSIAQALGCWQDAENEIQFAGKTINWWTAKSKKLHVGKNTLAFDEHYRQPSDVLTGRGVLFPIRVFQEVGNYDTKIRHRGDPELSRRAAKAGWELYVYFGTKVLSYRVKGDGNISERKKYKLSDLRDYYFNVLSHAEIGTTLRNARSFTTGRLQFFCFFICHMCRLSHYFLRHLCVR
jgi:GT2 family glycosyltransferase